MRFFTENHNNQEVDEKNQAFTQQNISSLVAEKMQKMYPLNSLKEVGHDLVTGLEYGLASLVSQVAWQKTFTPNTGNKALPHLPILPSALTPSKIIQRSLKAPLVEEVVYRGMVMPCIETVLEKADVPEPYAKVASVIASSALFSLAHQPGKQGAAFIGGMIYGSLAISSNNLWSSTAAHSTYNSTLTAASLIKKKF